MKGILRLAAASAALVCTGCGDSAAAILRDYYNIQNEIVDHMVYVCDEDSARKFNELCGARIQPKETSIQERKDKMNKQLVTAQDQERFAKEMLGIEAANLKGEVEHIDSRYRKQQHRIRRIIVKLAELKMEEEKVKDQSFVVSSGKEWPSLSGLYTPNKFTAEANSSGPMIAMPGMPAPGGGPPGMPGMPGMPGAAPPGAQGGANPVSSLANKNLNFTITCDRIVHPDGRKEWKVTRRWKSGGTEVSKLEINGVNLVPMFGDQP